MVQHPYPRPVAPLQTVLRLIVGGLSGDVRLEGRLRLGRILGMDDAIPLGADPLDVGLLIAKHQGQLRASFDPTRPKVVVPEAVSAAFEDELEPLFACFERGLSLAPFEVQTALLQGDLHSRSQPRQPILEHVVACPELHALRRGFVAELAGHHDERNGPARLPKHAERPYCVELRQRVIGKDDVGLRLQSPGERVGGVAPLPLDIEAGALEFGDHELGVGGPVLNHHQPERRARGYPSPNRSFRSVSAHSFAPAAIVSRL